MSKCHCGEEATVRLESKWYKPSFSEECQVCVDLGCDVANAGRCLKKPFYDPSKDDKEGFPSNFLKARLENDSETTDNSTPKEAP
jgi:hypothetical protein